MSPTQRETTWAGGEARAAGRYEAVGVRIERGGEALLSGLDLSFEPGACHAVVGVNGAGKSTLLAALAGVLELAGGEVSVGGMSVKARRGGKALARRRAYLEQRAEGELAGQTTLESVMLGEYAWRRGWGPSSAEARARAASHLSAVGLSGYGSRDVATLSGGERRRAAMARIRASEAPWWLLDEPLAGVDMEHQGELFGVITAHVARGGGAVVVCHDLNWVLARCASVTVCHEGQIEAHGEPERVLSEALIERVFKAPVWPGLIEGERRWLHQR